MINALKSEWIKLTTTFVVKFLVLLAIVFPITVAVLVSTFGDGIRNSEDLSNMIFTLCVLTALLLGVVTAIGTTNEFNYGTIRPTFAALPRRMTPLLAKLFMHVMLAAVVMAVVLSASWVAGSALAEGDFPFWRYFGETLPVVPSLVGTGLLGIGLSALGFGLGLLIRNTPATVSLLLLWPLLGESLLALLFSALGNESLQKFLPYVEGINMGSWDPGGDALMTRVPGGVYFFAWVAALVILGLWRTSRSDA